MKKTAGQLVAVVQTLPEHMRKARYWLSVQYEPMVLPDAVPFLNPIDAICEEAPPRFMWSTHYILLGVFFTALLAAYLCKIDTVVVGRGTLTTESPPIILQPIERGIIREMRVSPGELVHKGQVLAVLDATFAHADLTALEVQRHTLQAQANRLEAELADKPYEVGKNPDADEALQLSLYRQRQDLYKSRLKVYDEEIQRLNASIHTTDDDRESLSKQLDYAKELVGMRGELLKSQFGSKLSYLDAETLKVRTEREYQDAVNHLTETRHALQSKQAERENYLEDWRRQNLEALSNARTELGKLDEAKAKATLINDMVMVTAPADGMVLDIAKRSVGSIMREAEPLITIVPSDAPLVADITVQSSDVGHIRAGNDVVVKVDAFPYQTHGLLKGRLLYVSEESYAIKEAGGESQSPLAEPAGAVHRGRVQLMDTKLEHLPEGAHLISGMTVSAEIKVGSRRVLSFFTYPLTRGLSESLREP
jgi:hemolysin D